jgi:hypothetical protein
MKYVAEIGFMLVALSGWLRYFRDGMETEDLLLAAGGTLLAIVQFPILT